MKYIAIFLSSRDVIKCDKHCRAAQIRCRIVPVPEKYSSSCGMSIEFEGEEHQRFVELTKKIDLEVLIYEK